MRLTLCFFCLVHGLIARPLQVEVSAQSAIIINADSGAILYDKNSHDANFPASTTKVATLLFLLERKSLPFDRLVTCSHEALKIKPSGNAASCPAYWGEVGGTSMQLLRGEKVSVEALVHGLMMISGNDAANVIAEAASGSIPKFMDEMNQYLQELGCQKTQFLNPHGLHHPEHMTTAYDMSLIAKKAFQIPKFREVVSKVSYMKEKTNKQKAVEIKTKNPLIKPGRKFYYPKSIGGKTGFHSNALNAYVSAASHEGRTLIAVLMGCPTSEARFKDAVRLFEKAFAEEKELRTLFCSGTPFSRGVEGAKLPLQAALASDITLCFFPAEEPTCKAFIHWHVPELPIQKGSRVGEVQICDAEGAVVAKADLLAQQDLAPTFLFKLQQMWRRIVH